MAQRWFQRKRGFRRKEKYLSSGFSARNRQSNAIFQVVRPFGECPDAASDEITGCFNGKAMGSPGLNDLRIPPESVG